MGRSGFRGAMRSAFSRDRVTGQVAFGLVGLLLVTAVVYGVGVASAKYRLADVGAWLSAKSKGVLVHVNGPAAKVDGKAALLPQMRNHRIKVVQDGNTVLLVDIDTGVVSRIDPSQLKVTQSKTLGGLNLQVLADAGKAYTVDPVKGAVQQIDPVSLAPLGPSAVLTPPLEEAGVDMRGTLWVPVPQRGEVTPFRDGRLLPAIRVGKAGDRLSLVMAAGEPVVVNSTAGSAMVLGGSGVRLDVRLPSTVQANVETLVPARTEGTLVPLLVQSNGSLALLDSGTGRQQGIALKLPKHRYQPPQILGPRIYIPDESMGQLHVYNTATGSSEKAIPVAGRNSSLEVFVKEGMLWAHDPGQPKAVVVDGNGAASAFGKYDTKVPGGDKRKSLPSGGDGRTPPPGPLPDPSVPPRPPGAPTPPTELTTRFEGGAMRIGFKPSRGGRPTGYVLKGVAAGLTAGPRSIPANAGALEFSVTGGVCDKEYRFRVAVQYRDAQGRPSELASDPSPPVRPCSAPLAPRNVKAEATAAGAKISWEPGAGTDDASTRYQVSWDGPGGAANKPGIEGTSITLGNIYTNGQYVFNVRAANGAGGSEGTALNNVTLTGPAKQYPIQHNDKSTAYVRAQPDKESAEVDTYQGNGETLTLLCQEKGADYAHPNGNPNFAGNLYNKVRAPKGDGYMIGYLAKTPNSAGSGWKEFLGPPLWRCK